MTFEEKCSALQQLIDQLENDNLSLDESVELYGKATLLLKDCLNQLEQAKIKLNDFSVYEEAVHE